MTRRRALAALVFCAVVFGVAGAAMSAPSTSVVISELRFRGPSGGNDEFVELYNASSSAVAIGGWQLKGSNSGGTTGTRATVPANATIGPGCHYLFTNSGSNGYSGSVTGDMTYSTGVGDDGGIAVVNSAGTVVDQVGLSTGSAYKEGTPLASLGSTNGDRGYERKPGGAAGNATDTDDNSADFRLVSPTGPQSSTSACISFGEPTSPSGSGAATPASVDAGASTLLTVAVTAGTNPASTGIAVTADLSSIGGPAAAAFHDDGADGDTAAGDGTYSYAATVAAGTHPGAKTLPFTIADAQSRSGSGSIALTVTGVIPIGEVQGAVPDTGDATTFKSPYVNQTVMVQGVVTELTHEGANNGFYLQNTAAAADTDPATSDGIFVFLSHFTSTVDGYAPVVGDEIRATGKVSEFNGQTELGGVRATKVGTASVTPFDASPPADPADAARYWERHEGMLASVPAQSVVDSPRHFYSSTGDTEFYALNANSPIAQRADPYAQRVYRDAHPLGGGSGQLVLITDEGIKAADPNAQLPPVHTYQRLTAEVTGGVYYDFGKYSVSASTQPQVGGGVDPYQDGPPPVFERSQAYSVANFNMENLYDYRDDPNDGCDFDGNAGCTGVTPPFDYTPASDAEYQGRETEIAHQIVDDLHSPDVIVVQEAEDQDICSVANGAMDCSTGDGQPDVLQELALHIQALGGPVYSTAFDRNGADARGIICAFMYRSDRVSLIPADAGDPVLGSDPQVHYRGAALAYDGDVSNPKALNAVLPDDVDRSTGVDGTNVFTRAVQVAHFRIAPTTVPGRGTDIWVQANHFTSNPDKSVGQREEQAAYNAAVVKAIQSADANAKVMVAGDLNVFPRPDSDQLDALYQAGLHDLYDTVLAQNPASAYSYSFTGRAQDLDHQFVTQSFFDQLNTVNEAHVNSDWTRVPGSNRGTSDHDPMVSQWNLPSAFDDVCELATQLASSPAGAAQLCADLARAEDAVAAGRRVQKAVALAGAAADVAKGIGRGVWTPREAVQLLKAIAKL